MASAIHIALVNGEWGDRLEIIALAAGWVLVWILARLKVKLWK